MSKELESKNWRNRVREYRVVSADHLRANPQNFRRHPASQSKALRGVLAEVGIAGALLAYEHPERGLELIDGHLRQDQGGEWPVLILDVTEAEANILLATYDPISAMAEQDDEALKNLLDGLEAHNADLAEMLQGLHDSILPPDDPWQEWRNAEDVPEYVPGERKPHITIYFNDLEKRQEFVELIAHYLEDQPITDKTKSLWFPKKANDE